MQIKSLSAFDRLSIFSVTSMSVRISGQPGNRRAGRVHGAQSRTGRTPSLTNQAVDLIQVSVVLLLLTESQEAKEWGQTQRRDSPVPAKNRQSDRAENRAGQLE